jgi:hypothetical protein
VPAAPVSGSAAEYKVSEVTDRNAGIVLKIGKERLRPLATAAKQAAEFQCGAEQPAISLRDYFPKMTNQFGNVRARPAVYAASADENPFAG